MCSEILYICFKEAKRPRWYMRFLKKGFSHCYAVGVSNGQYVKYECGHGVTRIDCFDYLGDLLKDCTIVKYHSKRTNRLFYINSCVGFVKAVAGIDCKAITPYQLYKSIR